MINRRDVLLGGLAAAAAAPLAAQELGAPLIVSISNAFGPGEIHVDPSAYSLYLTLNDGKAIRYQVGIGRVGLYESGRFYVGAKKEWPSWTPTPDMIAREPHNYARYADGMPGGPGNPLGARALYLYRPGRGDTYLRIHGTNRPETIGSAVSNGCVRLINSHIADLYNRVPIGTPVVLH